MGSIIGFLLTLIGLALLSVGLGWPQNFGAVLWQTLLGLIFAGAGLVMTDQSETDAGCLVTLTGALVALFGLALLILSLIVLVADFELFGKIGTLGALFRLVFGILFVGGGWYIIRRPDRDDFGSDPWS